MRIAYDHQIFALQAFGGISRYLYELISEVAAFPEMEVSLLQGFYINDYGLEKFHRHLHQFIGWKRERSSSSKVETLFFALSTQVNHWARMGRRFDIYHQSFYLDTTAPRGARVVTTIHDMIPELFPESIPPKARLTSEKLAAVKKADGVICASHNTRRDLLSLLDVPEHKVTVIHHGSSMTAVPRPERLIERPYLLYVGARGGYKNFEMLARAIAASPSIKKEFLLVCFGAGALTPEEHRMLAAIDLADNVRHMGGADEVLATLYRDAAALVYPSRYEGFGIPPLEAMHYGCPVLASRSSSIPEVVGEAGLYFDPLELDELVAQLERLLSDAPLRDLLVSRGYEQESRLTWKKCAHETAAYYRSLL